MQKQKMQRINSVTVSQCLYLLNHKPFKSGKKNIARRTNAHNTDAKRAAYKKQKKKNTKEGTDPEG